MGEHLQPEQFAESKRSDPRTNKELLLLRWTSHGSTTALTASVHEGGPVLLGTQLEQHQRRGEHVVEVAHPAQKRQKKKTTTTRAQFGANVTCQTENANLASRVEREASNNEGRAERG
jgi:hypothetical protein